MSPRPLPPHSVVMGVRSFLMLLPTDHQKMEALEVFTYQPQKTLTHPLLPRLYSRSSRTRNTSPTQLLYNLEVQCVYVGVGVGVYGVGVWVCVWGVVMLYSTISKTEKAHCSVVEYNLYTRSYCSCFLSVIITMVTSSFCFLYFPASPTSPDLPSSSVSSPSFLFSHVLSSH